MNNSKVSNIDYLREIFHRFNLIQQARLTVMQINQAHHSSQIQAKFQGSILQPRIQRLDNSPTVEVMSKFTPAQNEAVEVLHGLCTSSKDAPTIVQLLQDYAEMEGKQLDISGFRSTRDFLLHSGKFNLVNRNGITIVVARLTAETVHIVQMIQKQRSIRKKGGSMYPVKEGLFRAENARKKPKNTFRTRTSNVRPLRPLQPSNSFTKSHSAPNSGQSGQFNFKPNSQPSWYNNKNRGPQVKTNAFQRQTSLNLPPLPSQMAKVVNVEVLNKTQPIKSDTQVEVQKPSEAIIKQSSTQKVDIPVQNINANANSKPLIPMQPPKSQENVNNSVHTCMTVTFTKPAERTITAPKYEPPQKVNTPSLDLSRVESLGIKKEDNKQTTMPSQNFHNSTTNNNNVRECKSQQTSNNLNKSQPRYQRPSVMDRILNLKKSTKESYSLNFNTKPKVISVPSTNKENVSYNGDLSLFWNNFNENSNPINILEEYCKAKNISLPEYAYFRVKNNNSYKFQCRVRIEDTTYSTYPEDCDTKDKAQHLCALKAIESIKQRQELTKNPLFEGQREIIFASKRVELSPQTSISQCSFTELDVMPPKIKLPWTEKFWNVIITYAETTNSIWCNLLGTEYYEARVDLYEAIEETGISKRPEQIQITEHYLAVVHEVPHRVYVIEVNHEQGRSYCNYIDTGDQEWLSNDQIYVCDKKFFELPGQAVQLSLEGLSVFENLDGVDFCLSDLNEKVLVARIHSNEEEYLKNANGVRVTLYDTSTDIDINMNNELIQKIGETVIEKPKLVDRCNCVTITGVCHDGTITGYLKETGFLDLIKQEIKRITEDNTKLKQQQGMIGTDANEIYLVHVKSMNQFFRGKLSTLNNQEQIIVKLIDYGTDVVCNKSTEIYRLKYLSQALQVIPPQAISMKLHDVKNSGDEKVVSLIRGTLKPDTNALARVKNISGDDTFVVLFFRLPNGVLVNVNDAINEQINLSPQDPEDEWA
uniref:CSON009704 protein n=2 Tax=Culicoides sonorensis TaxID=179676 RepID=A0A336LXN2_CULSO